MKQKQRAAAPHFYVSPTALFYFCPVRILFLQLSEQSFLLMFLALRCNSVHGIVKLAKRFLLCLVHALRNLYHQRHEMVAAHVAVTQDGTPFPFRRTLVSVWVPGLTSYSTSPSTVLMRIGPPSAAFTKEIGTVE